MKMKENSISKMCVSVCTCVRDVSKTVKTDQWEKLENLRKF